MARRTGEASPPAGNISLRAARRELVDAAHSNEKAKAMSDYSDVMAGEGRDPSCINAIYARLDAIEDQAIRSIRDAMRNGGISAYFEGYGGERSLPVGWLDADWLRKPLLIDGTVPIDERNNRDRNGSDRLVYFRFEDWKALLSKLGGAASPVAVVATDASRTEFHLMRSVGGKVSEATFSAMAEVWEDLQVPAILAISEIQKKIADGMKRRGIKGGGTADNIRRILGLKK